VTAVGVKHLWDKSLLYCHRGAIMPTYYSLYNIFHIVITFIIIRILFDLWIKYYYLNYNYNKHKKCIVTTFSMFMYIVYMYT